MIPQTERRMTIDEKILLAASDLPEDGFTAESLVVAAFKKFQVDFCLMGFEQYPDSNKVLTQITTANRGLQKRGWLTQIGKKRYQLTGEGRRRATAIDPETDPHRVRADNRDIADMLTNWIRSEARQKAKSGKLERISEREALAYWRLTSGASVARTHRMLAVSESTARLLMADIATGQLTAIHHAHRIPPIPPAEAQELADLNSYLKKQFQSALDYLKNQKR